MNCLCSFHFFEDENCFRHDGWCKSTEIESFHQAKQKKKHLGESWKIKDKPREDLPYAVHQLDDDALHVAGGIPQQEGRVENVFHRWKGEDKMNMIR